MARYYKYHSPEDVETDARSLGLEISTSQDFSVLLTPCTIGPLTAKNRLLVQPMEGCDGTLEGAPDELTGQGKGFDPRPLGLLCVDGRNGFAIGYARLGAFAA